MKTQSDSVCSGSPRSSSSDRHYTFEDDKIEDLELDNKHKAGESTCSSSKVEDANGQKGLSARDLMELEEDNILFRDFTEPDIMKTGYLIPLKCGHNGQLSLQERNIYEIHLTSAGFIKEADNHNSSDSGS